MTNSRITNDATRLDPEAWERLSTLFETVMSLPPQARVAFLDTACQDDAPMRAELLTLISGAEDAPRFLQALASDVVAPAFDAATIDQGNGTNPSVSLTGRRIRHFEVRTPLGSGGMGSVYLGRDTMLDRDVALKFLPPEQFTDPAARRRLIREAQAASALNDPNVCAMYAIEETDDGGLCLVMSYCGGGTLRDRIRTGPLSIADAVSIATQLASGLASAHRSNIVHRDLKPANIGFDDHSSANGESSARTIAKILDFGVAVRADRDDVVSSGIASVAGTLPYMAPEVLRGGIADARADVWALGIILYEMLAGRRPFVGTSEAALLRAILDDAPAPLVRPDGTDVPPRLAALVTALLSKLPTNRPADGADVLSRLHSLALAPEPSAPSERVAPKSRVRRARRMSSTTLAMLAFGVGVVGAIGWWARASSNRSPEATSPLEVARTADPLPTIAVLPFTVRGSGELQYLREGMVDLLTPVFDATGLLRGVDPNASIGAARALRDTPLDSSNAPSLAKQLGARRYVLGSVVRAGAGFTLLATLYHDDGHDVARAQATVPSPEQLSVAVESLVRQLVAAELRAPGDTVAGLAATMTTSNRALRAYLDGERELRDARPAAAVAHFTRAIHEDSLFALAWYRLARAARWSDVDSLNAVAVQRAFELSASLPLRLQQLVRAYYALRVGSPIDAERQFRRIVADYPTDVDAWMLLGETLFDNNQYQGRSTNEAVAAFRRVMALDMRNREVTVYLMELAARGHRHGELDTLFQMYFSPNSAGEQPGIRETYLALHARRSGLSEHAVDDPVSAQIALRRVGAETSDIRAARQFASVLTSPSNDAAMRLEGLLALATLDWSAGQADAAARHWHDAAALNATATLFHRVMMYVSPSGRVSADTVRGLRQELESTRATPSAGDEMTRDEQQSLQVYLTGLLSTQLQDTTALRRSAQQLAKGLPSDRLASPLAAALRGHLARLLGNDAEAVTAFESSVVSIPFHVRLQAPALGQQFDRLARADALRKLGRIDEANRWYASILDGPALWSTPYRAVVAERMRSDR